MFASATLTFIPRVGYIFRNRFGERITTRGIAQQLKNYAERYGLNTNVVYPHSFRHRYAKNFLDAFNDLALLADLMGHESIETTRIYLRRTASEQQAIVDKVITLVAALVSKNIVSCIACICNLRSSSE